MTTLSLEQVETWHGPPLVLFVGVLTGDSLAHAVFGRWAALLDRPWTLRGVDLPPDTPPTTYRRLVAAVADNPAVHGAVITAHKLRLYRACADAFQRRDRLANLAHEVNTLAATDGAVSGYARDALALTRILPRVPHVLCLGAGGAGTALLLALLHLDTAAPPPARVVFADTSRRALDDLEAVAVRAGIDPGRLSLVPVRGPDDCDALVADLPQPAVVVNATGLGKDAQAAR
jgi:shikimate dehydrogenase